MARTESTAWIFHGYIYLDLNLFEVKFLADFVDFSKHPFLDIISNYVEKCLLLNIPNPNVSQ